MKEFFVQNWKLLILAFCALLEIISAVNLFVLQRKKSGDDSIQFVIAKLPSFISSIASSNRIAIFESSVILIPVSFL